MNKLRGFVFGALLLAALPAYGQTLPTPEPPAAGATIEIPAETSVQIELTEPLSSRASQIGQTFGIRLAEPILVGGAVVVPAGAVGGGEVIDAHPAAFGGRQGRLIISGRYLEINGARVRIHAMQITATGQGRTNTALAVSMIPYAGIAGIFVTGGNVEIPAGARGDARLGAAVSLTAPVTQAQPATTETTQPIEGGVQQ